LIARLGGGCNGYFIDALGRQRRIPAHELADALDHKVIGSSAGIDALLARLAEGGSYTVDEDDIPDGPPGTV
ncbi:hypothetical protein, partial [Chryseobacterium sp. SIMBA_029]|uniref:hypothetical protein n=1 Tax=Chryseobacterium sp. SIMBA_029 TaxID=3085772 RepID=UPI003979B8B2